MTSPSVRRPRFKLVAHPAALALPLRVHADARRDAGGLVCRYRIEGGLDCARFDYEPDSLPERLLWQHTCCEAFVPGAGSGYREFNVAVNGQWTCFDFVDTRVPAAGAVIDRQACPGIQRARDGDAFALELKIPAALLPGGQPPRKIGLTVVIEARGGGHAYYAAQHAGPKPDFHDRRTWTLEPDAEGQC